MNSGESRQYLNVDRTSLRIPSTGDETSSGHVMSMHTLIGLLQHRDEQLLLAAEVVIDKILADLAHAHDVVDARTVISLGGELLGRHIQNSLSRFAAVSGRPLGNPQRLALRRDGARSAGRSLAAAGRPGLLVRLFAVRPPMMHDLGLQERGCNHPTLCTAADPAQEPEAPPNPPL
jgi:hypothetical protein